jgi:hypothetical protein
VLNRAEADAQHCAHCGKVARRVHALLARSRCGSGEQLSGRRTAGEQACRRSPVGDSITSTCPPPASTCSNAALKSASSRAMREYAAATSNFCDWLAASLDCLCEPRCRGRELGPSKCDRQKRGVGMSWMMTMTELT